VASREKLVSMLNKQEELENLVADKRDKLSNLESELIQLRSEDEAIQLQLMREGNDATSTEIARIEKLIETTKQKDEEYKHQLRQFIEYAPFAITGKLFKDTRDQIEYDFKLREAKNDQLSRNLVVSQITSDLMLMFEHSTISSPEKSELILQVQDVLEKYKHDVTDENVLLSVTEQDYEEFLAIYNNLTTTYKSEFEHLAEDYKKNKLVLERNSRRLSNIQSKEKDELIKSIRTQKNQIEKTIAQKDAEIRQMHESIGEMSQELATVSKLVSELSKKVSLDDSDAKKDAVAEQLIDELSTFLISLKQEKKYSLERRIKTTLNTLMHKEDFIGKVGVVIDGEDMDINLYSVDGKVINKDSLSKGEQQLYATSILKALVDESGIQFPVFIDSPLQKFDKSHATKIITEFYPQISKQVVLFPLLYKELTAEEYNVMKPLVKATYLIKNDVTHSFFEEVPVKEFIKES
jgi:DNA sulfur modification protein DndD